MEVSCTQPLPGLPDLGSLEFLVIGVKNHRLFAMEGCFKSPRVFLREGSLDGHASISLFDDREHGGWGRGPGLS